MLVLLCENFLYSYQAAGFAGGSSLRAALRPVLGASKANCGMIVLQKNRSHGATDSGCVDRRATKTLARLRLGLEKFTEDLWREIGLAKDRSQRAAG